MLLADTPSRLAAPDHLLLHFARNGSTAPLLVLERGEGPFVFDEQGNRYLSTVWGAAHPAAVALSAKLAEILPGDLDHVFFTNGGSESVESAWKLVRQYHVANGEPQRLKAIARDRAYHGVTLGALSLTGVPGYQEQFGAPAIPVTHVSNTNAFRGLRDGEDEAAFCARLLMAMIIAEPVQNAGGCLVPPAGYWPGLREIADRYGILLVADEVICGFGRLGEWLGVTRFDTLPDLVTTAKGITSAYAPIPRRAARAADRRRERPRRRAAQLVGDEEDARLTAEEREFLLRELLPGRLLDAGLIARADDRGDAVLHLAPPLISDREILDLLVGRVADVLTDAGTALTDWRTKA